MPSKPKSPFASMFKAGVKSGQPCHMVVSNICKRTGKPMPTIFQSLYKAGLCFRQKFNGQWIYWPCFTGKKCSTANCNTCQTTMWQCFVDWCIASGCCTPAKLNMNCGSQKEFMTFCRTFFGKQFTNWSSSSSKSTSKTKMRSKPKRKSRKPLSMKKSWSTTTRTKKRTPKKTTWARNYKFPTFKSRKLVKAA